MFPSRCFSKSQSHHFEPFKDVMTILEITELIFCYQSFGNTLHKLFVTTLLMCRGVFFLMTETYLWWVLTKFMYHVCSSIHRQGFTGVESHKVVDQSFFHHNIPRNAAVRWQVWKAIHTVLIDDTASPSTKIPTKPLKYMLTSLPAGSPWIAESEATSDGNSYVRGAWGIDSSQFLAFIHPLDQFLGEQVSQSHCPRLSRCLDALR